MKCFSVTFHWSVFLSAQFTLDGEKLRNEITFEGKCFPLSVLHSRDILSEDCQLLADVEQLFLNLRPVRTVEMIGTVP